MFLLLILYMLSDQPVLEKSYAPTLEACQAAGQKRLEELNLDTIIVAGCIQVKIQEAQGVK